MLAPLVIELHAIECGLTDLEIRVHHSAVSPQEQLGRLGLRGKLHGADNGGVRAGVGEHHGVAHFHLGHVRIRKDQIRAGAEVARHGDGLPLRSLCLLYTSCWT